MHKCDSCGKVVVNEQDYMCPHCGAVAQKHCDHSTHLPDDKYNRANDYRTAASEHKSKTYDYEKAPKTDNNQKFDINDLANIKNAEDAKRIAKKAFIEQDQNGRKKFKPVAIVLIVIFAINIFANVLDLAFSAVDDVFEGIESAFSEEVVVGEDLVIHNFTLHPCLNGATFDRENDCLTLKIEEIYFDHYGSHDEYYDYDTDEWQDDFSFPGNHFLDSDIDFSLTVYDENDVKIVDFDEDAYKDSIDLAAELTENGELKIYGLKSHLRNIKGKDAYCCIGTSLIEFENDATNEEFECDFYFPFNYIKISSDDTVGFYDIYKDYETEDRNTISEVDISSFYVPDEYVECIEFSDVDSGNIFESVPASVTYTETVTLVD